MTLPRNTLLLLFTLFLLLACSTPSPKDSSQSNPDSIQALLPGDYIGMSSRGKVFHSIVQLQVPKFGGEVFYHHISTESLHGVAMQRKIYAFDASGKQMRSTVLLGSGEMIADKKIMAIKLNQLTEEELLRFPDGCQFQWTNTKEGFRAEVLRTKCSYQSPAFGGLVSPEMEYQLNRCGLNINEGIYREDDSPVFPPSTILNQRVTPVTEGC